VVKIVCKIAVALVVCACLNGCGPLLFHTAPKNVADYTESSMTIRQGETTRAQVHELLGAPTISSHSWKVDIHRISGKQFTLGVMTAFLVPLFPWAENVYWDGYVLATYDDNDRVRAFASGKVARGDKLLLQANGVTLTHIRGKNLKEDELVLFANGESLTPYLKLRGKEDVCTLIVACERGADCPDRFSIEDERAPTAVIDPRFVRKGDFYKGVIPVPVMYPIRLSPGENRLVIGNSDSLDRSETGFTCRAGGVCYATIQSKVITGGKRQSAVRLTESMPEDWSGYNVIIWRESGVLVLEE
jgi:uncharacterized protein YceK